MRILYVDDDPRNIFLVQRISRMSGHEISHFTVVEDAVATLEHNPPDLVLMNLDLVGALEGVAAVLRLRAEGSRVALGGIGGETFQAAGCDVYLPGPLPPAEIIEFITCYEVRTALYPIQARAATGRLTMPKEALRDQTSLAESVSLLDTLPSPDTAGGEGANGDTAASNRAGAAGLA